MALQVFRSKPIQASKLTAIVLTLLFAVGGVCGYIPGQGFNGLFGVILLGVVLTFAVTVETLVAGYRWIGRDRSLAEQFADRRLYTLVRAIEVVCVIASAGGFVALVTGLPDEPPAGPGAIGLVFILTKLCLVILAGSLIRTTAEYYYHRRADAV